MTQPRFTPGPWSVVKHDRFPFEREVKAEDGYICDMEGLSDADMPTVEANANLIATAPNGYALAEEIADYLYTNISSQDISRIRTMARELLAKADGKESQ